MFWALVALVWIAYKLGKEDGKWGLLIVIGIVILVGSVVSQAK